MSLDVMDRILPNRNEKISTEILLLRLIKNTPIAIENGNNIPTIVLMSFLFLKNRNVKKSPMEIEKTIPKNMGDIPKKIPNAIPPKAECAMPTGKKEIFFVTIKNENIVPNIPINIPLIKLCMKKP